MSLPVDRPGAARRRVLRPVVELNARFTMGTVAVGLLRRALERVRSELELGPGERRAFWFASDGPPGGWDAARIAAGRDSLLVPLSGPREPIQPALLFAGDGEAIDRALAAG